MYKYDVSVIIACYNSDLKKTLKTIESSLLQSNVSIQIVIADDGSKNNNFKEIANFFEDKGFSDYILIGDGKNRGTVSNLLKALRVCQGEFTKFLSPGDFLYEEKTLEKWLLFLRKYSIKLSFGLPVYYKPDDKHSVVKGSCNPFSPQSFSLTSNNKKFIFDYIVLEDDIIGATVIGATEKLIDYISIIDGKVKFAEDNCYRIMAINGIRPVFFQSYVIWYEFGTGISTSAKSTSKDIISKDYLETDKIILSFISKKKGLFYFKLKLFMHIIIHYKGIMGKTLKNIVFPSRIIRKKIIKLSSYCQSTYSEKVCCDFINLFYYNSYN